MEKMTNNKISFQDVMLEIDIHSENPIFSIFRKPTSTNSYIHFFLFSSPTYKNRYNAGAIQQSLNSLQSKQIGCRNFVYKKYFKKLYYPDSLINKAYHRAIKNFCRTNNQNDLTMRNICNLKVSHRLNPDTRVLFKNIRRIIQCIPHTVVKNFTIGSRMVRDMDKNGNLYHRLVKL